MKVVEQSREFSKVELYTRTVSPLVVSLKNISDGDYSIDGWVLYTDVDKKTGEEKLLLSVLLEKEGVKSVCATNSKTFQDSFSELLDFVDGDQFKLRLFRGTSNAGREYLNCALPI